MQAVGDETILWWLMVTSGCAAAGLSLYTSALGLRREASEESQKRYRLNMVSYVLLSVSIMSFVVRGLMLPQ